ncbi:Mss4-like protein [Aspergillus granulosus]|uniref:Mss4-like protein n=1 Tax=Aspergillus granulosus TaxID=176169 RepID=A0ABR4H565_9EURO
MSTKTLTAHCHCRSTHFTLTVPIASLPLKAHLCHCTLCRTTHGTAASFHTPLPQGVNPDFIAPSSWDNLTAYLPPGSKEPLYFCSTCGCHVGVLNPSGIWGTSISILEGGNKENEIWVIDEHIYTERGSTGDGGIAELVPKIAGKELRVWNPEKKGTGLPMSTIQTTKHEEQGEDVLLAQCNCGGVSFTISRPREEFINSPRSAGWIYPTDKSKWLAVFDLCTDCRLLTGAHVNTWLFVPKDHTNPPVPPDLVFGTMKRYESTPGEVSRTFCGTCGATVFAYVERRSGIVDVATGILRAKDGVMLKDWAVWRTARVGFLDDGLKYDKDFSEGLDQGTREWGSRVHGGVVDFRIAD